ncbi:hypothetical protein [Cellulomonas dongxiuzhuiae]|uniref:Uncharacterized protein n=1 Tax=Cellulomonas dongxiuzhuiae TaxID=2819979 RepID=A0ABX8GML5_9CELL|nr:hypothetical protein [Cellulomonas dongxiuzhuiae]MBO3095876.1 hypothetical protein [Cellulomonas dongxiuzhuiae]QWC17178.1 hypothetical protein KKR89_06155 [Cellulomonas dongxiuzhuiae]
MTAHSEIVLTDFKELDEFLDDREHDDPRTFVSYKGSPGLLAAVMKLLDPPLVEHRGAVFLGFAFDAAVVDEWFLRLAGDVAGVERIVNHLHVWEILPTNAFDEDEAKRLVGPIAQFWRSALQARFPDRRFVVETECDADYGPEVTFYTSAPRLK